MDVTFSIESAAGIIPLRSTPGEVGPYRLGKGTTGLGLVPEVVQTAPSPGGGAVLRSRRPGVREGTLVLGASGATRTATEALMRNIARVIRTDAAPQLVAVIPGDGTYRLPFIRIAGGEDAYDDFGDEGIEWSLEVQALQPYWVRDKPVSFYFGQDASTARGLLPDLAELPVMASGALGDITVTNPGDVAAPMSWRFTGEGGPVTVNVGGRGFTIPHMLAAGEIVQIDRAKTLWKVTDQDGANAYSKLGPAPKFPLATAGTVTGNVLMESATGGTVAGWFNPLRELVH